MSRRTHSPWIAALLVLGGTALTVAYGGPDDLLRMSQNLPGDSRPVVVTADEICTWTEGRQRVFLFKGAVLIEHGVVHARMQQAVGWVDLDRSKKTGITRIEFYGEGNVGLENGTESKTGGKTLFDLNTRGELRFKCPRSKIAQQEKKDDPLYRTAAAEKAPKAPATATVNTPPPKTIQRTSYQIPDELVPTKPAPAGTTQQPRGNVPGGGSSEGGSQWVIPAQSPPPNPVIDRGGAPPAGIVVPPSSPGFDGPSAPQPVTPGPSGPGSPAPVTPGPNGPGSLPREQAPRRGPPRQINMVPRSGATMDFDSIKLPNGEVAYIVKGGLIVTVTNPTDRVNILDMEADQAIVWMKRGLGDAFSQLRSSEGSSNQETEFYLAGNVEIRSQDAKQTHTLRADEVYYDVDRNVAVAYQADLEFDYIPRPGSKLRLLDPVHVRADELLQVSPNLFEANRAEVFSSRLPSDPGLKVYVRRGKIEQKQVTKHMFLGFGPEVKDATTGEPIVETQRIFKGVHVMPKLENVPFFYVPYLQGDVNDPLGPLESININYNKMYGTQIFTTWNVYDLIGITPNPGTRWTLNVDFMNKRGPALGTNYDYLGSTYLGIPSNYVGYWKLYGMYDKGFDLLGGGRGIEGHPLYRGRAFWHHNQELPGDFTVQAQVSGLSDKNFLEEYYYNEWNTAPNQETFIYLKQQPGGGNFAWTFLTEARIRNWIDETQKLPAADAYLLGESLPFLGELFGNRLTYNAHASTGYYRLMTTHVPPPPVGLTTFGVNTGRFDLWQDASLPFSLGDLRLAPFGLIDLTQYTANNYDQSVGRFYGGGGMRGSVPLSRLFPDVQSELLNLNGIYHKVNLSGNYYVAHSNVAFTTLPQLDRLNDDPTDQSLRDIKPEEPIFQPGTSGLLLKDSTLYDPQVYAIRKLQLNRVDTLDTINVLQGDLRQRWQTKRGYPGQQHIVDWMTLDVTASYFPQPGRSNFNEPFGLIQYYWIWNIGDRTALVSDGWDDPMANGARVWSVGGYFNRTDRTSFFVGYRNLTPVSSQLLSAAVSYVFSPKYAMTAGSAYDFATNQGLSNSLMFTRMGKDLQISMGFTYNAILNNFGFLFEILPNAAATSGRHAAFGSSMLAR